jgi:hypothetical protein
VIRPVVDDHEIAVGGDPGVEFQCGHSRVGEGVLEGGQGVLRPDRAAGWELKSSPSKRLRDTIGG